MSVELLSYNAPIHLSRTYNPTTKNVDFSSAGNVTIRFTKYTTTTCGTTPANWRGRMYLGCINGDVGACGGASTFPNMVRKLGTWDSSVSYDYLTGTLTASVDAKWYNTNMRGKGYAWRGYDYSVTSPSNCALYQIWLETGGYLGAGYCAHGENYYHTVLDGSVTEPPLPPSAQVITATRSCISGVTTNTISIPSPVTTNCDYFSVRKATGLTSTYVEVVKLYVSGGTFTYADTTDVNGYYKVYACNNLYIDDYPSNIVEIDFNPAIEAQVIYSDYPTLTFTAQTTNWCEDVDNVLWYLDDVLTGTTTGNTFTGLLPTETDIYELTAKYVKSGITGLTSNIVELIFFYTGTSLTCFTSNGTMVIPSYFNRMNYLMVAGGGAGGNGNATIYHATLFCYGGGGGAGGMIEGNVINLSGGSYPVVVGSGGTTVLGVTKNGGNSTFYGLTAVGGGAGGNRIAQTYSNTATAGAHGGSGGGGAGGRSLSATYGTGTSGQGNNGAAGASTTRGGGGGGKSTAASAGTGGTGKASSITGIPVATYSTGGSYKSTVGDGTDATPNTGDGGQGGCCNGNPTNVMRIGGDGGSGKVCVYLYNYYPLTPVAPSGLTATLIDCDSTKLTWVNNDTTEVTGIHIQQNSGGTWVTIHDVTSGTTNYTLTGLTPNTEYEFRVVAYNDLFNGASDSVIFTTLDATPYNVDGYADNLTAPFTWSINDTGYGTAIYPMIRVSGTTTWTTGATLSHNATSYTFTGLSFNNDYEVQIVRRSVDGDYASDIFEFSTNDFIAPVLSGYLTGTDVTLEILDTNINREDYEIYRDIGGTGYTLIATISGTTGITTYVDSAIGSGVTYTYKVRSKLTSFSPVLYSNYSNTVYAKIVIIYGATGLTASNIGYTGLTLTWVNNNTGNTSGNHVQQFIGGVWTDIAAVSSATTTYDVTGLTPNTGYYFRIETYNGLQTVYSPILNTSTLNPTPFGLTATTVTLFYQDLTWNLLTPAFGDYIRVEYRLCSSSGAFTTFSIVAYDRTTETLTGLTMGECYTIRVVTHSNTFGDYPSTPFDMDIPAPNYPSPFCDGTNYSYTGSTCGASGGSITITNQEYLLYYNFVLTDIFGNTYTLVLDTYNNLPAGYYFLSATAKDAYKWYYGYDACIEFWIEITDTDNPMYLASLKIKPAQCLSFDVQYGRIFYNVSGLTSGSTYSFWAFSSDLSLFYSATGLTGTTQFIINNAPADCYWVIIKDEVSNCILLIPNKCVPTVSPFSHAGIKKLWIAKWSDDLDYNYWKDSDEDYFLEFEDTTFFNSTKIKEYLSLTGGTTGITWYILPLAFKYVSLGQKLSKVRQGFIFRDTLTVAVTKATAAKWVQMATILNPENRWIYVVLDANDNYWTGGYRHGAEISTYAFNVGLRGEDDGYKFTFACESENKLLTSIDSDYVTTYIE